jgi:Ca-activated chloride channel family protein
MAAQSGPIVLDGGLDQDGILQGPDERFLVLEVRAPASTGEATRRPVDLAVVLDGSGSMSAAGKIGHAKEAARQLARAVGPDDTYSLIVFNDSARVIRPASPVTDARAIDRLLQRVYEGGGTNLHQGLVYGGREIARVHGSNRVGRVVVLSDGKATVGIIDPDQTAGHAAELAVDGITVSTIGLGLDYNEDALAKIADLGGGSYDFVDTPSTLTEVFDDELQRSFKVVARGARVRLELLGGTELLEVIGWETSAVGLHQHDIWLGDIVAGETRRIVARVRTDATTGTAEIASARIDYSHSNGLGYATLPLDLPVVSASEASALTNDKWAAIAQRAWANLYVERSTRAYASGDVAESRELIREGQQVLEAAARDYDAPGLLNEARALDDTLQLFEHNAPSSAQGRRAIKSTKETFRGRVR